MSVNKPLTLPARLILWFVAANALVGAVSLIGFPSRTDDLFFWPINPPINAALFGALYLGGAAVVAWVAYRGEWEPARFLVPVLVSAGVFISATTLIHRDAFTPGIRLAYWLVIYIGAPLLALGIYWTHERPSANWSVTEPVLPTVRLIAIGLGGLLLVLGLVVLASPAYIVEQWPWPTSPLMVRIFTSWFSAFGVGLLWFAVERDWRRVGLIATMMIAASALDLLLLAVHRDDLTGDGLNVAVYCFHLGLFGVVGLAMHVMQYRARQPYTTPAPDTP